MSFSVRVHRAPFAITLSIKSWASTRAPLIGTNRNPGSAFLLSVTIPCTSRSFISSLPTYMPPQALAIFSNVRFFMAHLWLFIFFQGNLDQFLAQFRIIHSQCLCLLGNQACGRHSRHGVCLQAVHVSVFVHDEIQSAVGLQSQCLVALLRVSLHFPGQ